MFGKVILVIRGYINDPISLSSINFKVDNYNVHYSYEWK